MKQRSKDRDRVQCQADKLFDVKYLVTAPFYALVDKPTLEHYGVVGHYDKVELDKLLSNETVAKINLSRMAELVAQNIPIRPQMTARQMADAFNAITEHIENWIKVGNKVGFWQLPPLEDLLAFDELASFLYNQIEFDGETKGLTDYLGINTTLMGNRTKKPKPPYHSYADFLIEKCTQGKYRTVNRR